MDSTSWRKGGHSHGAKSRRETERVAVSTSDGRHKPAPHRPVQEVGTVSTCRVATHDDAAELTQPLPGSSIRLIDAGADEVAHRLKSCVELGVPRPYLAFALHVGGLNLLSDATYVSALERGDMVYADGISAVWVARSLGGRRVKRCPTTDLASSVLALASIERPIRLALIGGTPGLALEAGRTLAASAASSGRGVEVVYATDGYKSDVDWSAVLGELRSARPDVVLVGMGAPLEQVWCSRHFDNLPACVVITCGGLFGHVVGLERRAPAIVQRCGLEWTWRLAQRPQLLGRYTLGAFTTLKLLWVTRKLRH